MATYYPQNELEERIAETMNPPVPSSTACRNCYGEGVRKGERCPRCQGSGRELASLMGVDRIGGRSGHTPKV